MNVQIAISNTFLRSFSKLPQTQQKKTREFLEKFRIDPFAKGLNYEKLGVSDGKLYSARVDQTYRVIVAHPPKGDVYLMAWVDKHDPAYDWAARKHVDVHPQTGTLQIYTTVDGAPPPTDTAGVRPEKWDERVPPGRLFAGHTNEDLRFLGVPDMLLPSVRVTRSEDDLLELLPYLPEDAAEALMLLASGYSLGAIVEEIGAKPATDERPIDEEDFEAALARERTQAAFALVDDDDALAAMLDAPLEQWRRFLHPTQRRIVEWTSANGAIRVLGGAGTGKTVVLMHRAQHLAVERFNAPSDRLLVTTFSRNLAADLSAHLDALCGQERSRIEVANLHAWGSRYLQDAGVDVRYADAATQRACWDEALLAGELEYAEGFYRDEWTRVVQAQGVTEVKAYLRADRAGRGIPLTGRQRLHVWSVLERYRDALRRRGRMESADIVREARLMVEERGAPYASVLADEVQDFTPNDLRLLRALAPVGDNDLFLVGDAHQRIYGTRTTFSRCGIEVRGRSRRLTLNYRTTERIRAWAVACVEGRGVDDLDGSADTLTGYHSLRVGVAPGIETFADAEAELSALVARLRGWIDQGMSPHQIVVATRSNQGVEHYLSGLRSAGIAAVKVDTSATTTLDEGVRVATMHRLKGLEFPKVVIAGVNDGVVPFAPSDYDAWDVARKEAFELGERCLLYVAATRARDELVITAWGTPSAWL